MHSIGLGYHKDLQTRAAFMEVLTKILQQGTQFDTLAENVHSDRFDQLVQLVTMIGDKGELPIAMALANVVTSNQMDELARVFVTLFDAKHLLSALLWNMFYREVDVLRVHADFVPWKLFGEQNHGLLLQNLRRHLSSGASGAADSRSDRHRRQRQCNV